MSDLGKINFLKGSARFQRAPEKSISIELPISGKQKEIDQYQRNISLNLAEVYNMERQESTSFEPTCKFQLIFSNAYSGVASTSLGIYTPFNNFLYYLNPQETKSNQVQSVNPIPWPGFPQYNEFNFIRKVDLFKNKGTITLPIPNMELTIMQLLLENSYSFSYMKKDIQKYNEKQTITGI